MRTFSRTSKARALLWELVLAASVAVTKSYSDGASTGSSVAAAAALPGPFSFPGASFAHFLVPKRPGLGYPPIPFEGYPTWRMNGSTAAFFLGNDTGLNSVSGRPPFRPLLTSPASP